MLIHSGELEQVMLAFAMISFCAISSIVCLMTFAAPRADAIIGLVACWALAGDFLLIQDALVVPMDFDLILISCQRVLTQN